MEGRDRILPVFYHVDPSHVRHQLGSYAEAFTRHHKDSRQSKEKLDQWRLALKNVADLSGWDTKNFRSERELVKRIVKFVRNKVLQVPPRPIPFEFKAQPTDDFESTRRARDNLIKALKDNHITAIGVYGMGGVGKTTLVKHVSAQARELGLVNYVIRAVVGQSPELRNIQGTLADQLGLKFEKEETEIGRAARLLERIMGGNKILIVLDDVWHRLNLSRIGIPSYDELQRRNSKLILTSRRMHICYSMECQARIHLDILSEEDSWNLFVEQSGKSFHKSTELYDVARKVARECDGLPLSLIIVARALGDKEIEEWKKAAQRLEMSQPANPDDGRDQYICVVLSYDYLRSDDAKSFFLLCCLFPEDYNIPIEGMLKYAIGKGLLQDVKTIQEARATANSVIKSLRASGLLLDGTKGCVRMHDVVRDAAMMISLSEDGHNFLVKAGCALQRWPRIIVHTSYSAISLMMNDIDRLPEELVCSELQILLLQNNAGIYEIPETFFLSLNALRVLDISFTNISLPPRSFNILTNLQALFLDYCNKLIDVSRFRNLKKLEILSMREFPLQELPKEIGYLTNLRMLDVSGSYTIGIFPYNVMSRLCKLEELYMQCNSGGWGSKIHGGGEETNVGPDELIGLTHLNIVKLHISDAECLPKTVIHSLSWINFDICISRESPSRDYSSKPYFSDDHPRTLTLSTTIKSLPDWFINTVTEKAGKLQYLKCKGLKNILVEYDRGRLHGLKYLAVIGPHENLKVLMETITWMPNQPVFENLEELRLLGVSCLKALCLGELPPGSLFNLKSLKVEYCHDLVSAMLQSNLLKSVQNLEKLHCEDMNGMEYVFGSEGLEPEGIILTKLREMILWDLEKLISIWNGPAPNAVFRNLKSMAVSGCKKLKSLFTYDVAECLFHLEDLSVTQCPSLDRVIEPSKEAVNKKIWFPALKILALSYLPHLTRFCSTDSATIECPSLEHLHVQDCPHFTTSISDFHSWKQFQVNDLRHLRMSKDMVNIDLAGQHTTDILESLPQNIRKRVEVIREIQRQHDELQTKFFKERAALEAKYQKLYQPLFRKRYMIVNGVVEADGVTTEAAANQEDKSAKDRGVCDFWLNALKNNDMLANQITERDERALKYLKDIKWFRIHNPKGFKLEFYFDTNPFLKNSILTKTYHMIEDEPQKAVGTEIEWYPAKCLTKRILKGLKNSKPLTRTESCKSFFNFFSPPHLPEDDADVDEDVAAELKNLKKQDYVIGSIVRYKIIPHAVSWFTGEAF
ncbi:probable disease resistance protein At4g27220 [Rosa rugosa]|uniref:probable disease resistance protein At4g27220 n=1 Tax=Rosa rugosa TaxID=74645 RepID=UPI002B40996C|nr:probable disease resistance protein At4g27220 [Rosa rugosa]